MPADCRKWIIFLDQCKCILIAAFFCKLQISLYSDMSRTGCFTRCCSGIIAIDTVDIAVVVCPHMFTPWLIAWKWHAWICNLASFFIAEFLSQFHRSCRTGFHAFSTCDTVLFLYFCDICRTRHIWCIKEL